MGQTQWGFVRDYGNAQAFDDYKSMGLGGLLYNVEDPELSHGLQNALQMGFQAGAWIPAHTGEDPIAYARRMADYAAKYHPALLVPNVEFQGKGYKGSPGWQWSETMMKEFRRLNPSQQLAVSVMGNQDDFNYEAYTNAGARVMAQAYGANMDPWKADALRQQLIARGVDPSLIDITLAPGGHAGSGGMYSAYTLDDMNEQQRRLYAQEMQRVAGMPQSQAAAIAQATGRDPTPDILARSNRNATDVRLLGANTTGHILTQKEINALTPTFKKAVAVQNTIARKPTKARQAAKKAIKRTK